MQCDSKRDMLTQSAEPLFDLNIDKFLTGWALKKGYGLFVEQIKVSIKPTDIVNGLFWLRIICVHGFSLFFLDYLESAMKKLHATPLEKAVLKINLKNFKSGFIALYRRYPKEMLGLWNMIEDTVIKMKLEKITGIKFNLSE